MSYEFEDRHTVYPYGVMAFDIPRRWTCKKLDDGTNRWVCDEDDDADWTASFWICLELLYLPEDRQPAAFDKQRETARSMIGDRLPEPERPSSVRVEESDDDLFWTYEDTAMEDGDLLRFYWHRRMIFTDRGSMFLLTNLVILDDNKDDPEFIELARFIERQVRTVPITPPPEMAFDMALPQRLAAESAATDPAWQTAELEIRTPNVSQGPKVKIPADWVIQREEQQTWWATSSDGAADLKVQAEAGTPPAALDTPEAVSAQLDDLEGQLRDFIESLDTTEPVSTEDVWGGRLICATTPFIEDGEDWISYRHYICLALPSRTAVVRLILSLRRDLAPTPLGQALIAHVGKEARDMRIVDDDWRAAPLDEWRDVALDGRLFFRVPMLMDIRDDDRDDRAAARSEAYSRTWYAWFREDVITASMFITISERLILRDDDDDLFDITDKPEIYEKAIAPWVAGGVVDGVAHGWLKHERFDDTEDRGDEADPSDWRTMPMHNDHWNYTTPIPGGFLNVDWLLLTPYGSEDANVLGLIEQMDQAVRAAQFTRP